MALTGQQRADVRFYMGWPARFHQFDDRLEQAMSALDAEPESEAQVVTLIAECQDIDTKLKAEHVGLRADQVGSLSLPKGKSIVWLRKEGQRHVARMSGILGVEPRVNVFSSTPHRGFASRYGGYSGGGNYPPHG